jgi:hypothetical protein
MPSPVRIGLCRLEGRGAGTPPRPSRVLLRGGAAVHLARCVQTAGLTGQTIRLGQGHTWSPDGSPIPLPALLDWREVFRHTGLSGRPMSRGHVHATQNGHYSIVAACSTGITQIQANLLLGIAKEAVGA